MQFLCPGLPMLCHALYAGTHPSGHLPRGLIRKDRIDPEFPVASWPERDLVFHSIGFGVSQLSLVQKEALR